MTIAGPRNVATNPVYRRTYYRAYRRAVTRLIAAHRRQFQRFLLEERERVSLPYKKQEVARGRALE